VGEKHIKGEITPSVLFDQGYCTWNGVYPGTTWTVSGNGRRSSPWRKTDPLEYLKQLKSWAVERTEN